MSPTKMNEKISNHEFKLYNKLPSLLIVEDSIDVSQYLTAILKNEYNIDLAENGKIGLEKALKQIPDIVLSDVMMPEMDGIEMLEKIKNDFRTSHIPVVLLTAKADIDSRITGLERGADAYLAKPFNENELHIQLRNLIEQRKKLHSRYSSMLQFPETQDLAIKTEDAFMIKVRQILKNNMANEDYNIDNLCRELAVSHAQLYRKFKSLSNYTIADYFKLLRLHEAKKLLANSDLNITQIAFEVGFKNLSYFSREFNQQFGKSPKEMRNQQY
jgi:YesN/AraC family two-component response regulator